MLDNTSPILRHPQAPESEGVAGESQTLPHAFPADLQFADEQG